MLEVSALPFSREPEASRDLRLVTIAGNFLLQCVKALKLRPCALLSSKAPARHGSTVAIGIPFGVTSVRLSDHFT